MSHSAVAVTRDTAFATLVTLRQRYGEKADQVAAMNEAKTRLLLIDEVLLALGWNKDDFNPEQAARAAGFTDYLLSVDGYPRLVVEAKRAGHTFTSNKRHTKSEYTLPYARTAFGQPFSEVLEQAERYAREHGVPYAALTNGGEWVLVQLIPSPGTTADDCKCIFFGHLLKDEANFDLLWELLSLDAVATGRLAEHFAELNAKEAEFSANPRGEVGHFTWKKQLSSDPYLDDFYFLFFDQIVDPARRNMLQHCFVSNVRLDQYEGTLKRVLRDTAPQYIDGAQELTPGEHDTILADNLGDQGGRVILVTGSVGCGKSTFITKVLVDARQKGALRAVIVDLIDDVEGSSVEIDRLLWSRLLLEWKKLVPDSLSSGELKKIFHGDLEFLKRGPYEAIFKASPEEYQRAEAARLEELIADPESFLSSCFRYYRRHLATGIVVFLDNVDRASENLQKNVYAFAHRLARETGATVIVPMREMTFFRGKAAGFLDVRSSDAVFHLQAPDLVQVLSKRIRYVEEHLGEDHRRKDWRRREDFDTAVKAYGAHAATLKSNLLLGPERRALIDVLSAIAWHDVRSFLSFLKQIHSALGNGAAWSTSNATAALMTSRDTESRPVIPNLYTPPYPAHTCFFLKARILAALLYSKSPERVRQGIALPELLRVLRVYGYQDRWSRRGIEELVQGRLLECLEAPAAAEYTRSYRLVGTDESFRPSPLAVALFETIQHESSYMALIGNELPFHARQSYGEYIGVLKDVIGAIGGTDLEGESLSLLLESRAAHVVSAFLSQMLFKEQPLVDLSKFVPEVSAIEARLLSALQRVGVSKQSPSPRPEVAASADPRRQLDLIATADGGGAHITVSVACPTNVRQVTVDGSRAAGAIFWALVYSLANGRRMVTGAEITRLINQHVFSDQEKKESTNISRALRASVLRNQTWMAVSGEKGSWLYGLTEGWRGDWKRLFGQDPPDVGST
jgi:predicted DNA-binding ribbon-helix-helix protein